MPTRNEERLAIWRKMTPESRDYDRFVARRIPHGVPLPEMWRAETEMGRSAKAAMLDTDNPERGCSCHISPPCSYCESLAECETCGKFLPQDEMAYESPMTCVDCDAKIGA